jgi:hypothetical protein
MLAVSRCCKCNSYCAGRDQCADSARSKWARKAQRGPSAFCCSVVSDTSTVKYSIVSTSGMCAACFVCSCLQFSMQHALLQHCCCCTLHTCKGWPCWLLPAHVLQLLTKCMQPAVSQGEASSNVGCTDELHPPAYYVCCHAVCCHAVTLVTQRSSSPSGRGQMRGCTHADTSR